MLSLIRLTVTTWSLAAPPTCESYRPADGPSLSSEERRLQTFWRDHYQALKRYYGDLDRVDWIDYYKKQGSSINSGACPSCGTRIRYAPVFIGPTMQWAVPGMPFPGGLPAKR